MLISYATLGSQNREAAKAFYDLVLAPLGIKATYADTDFVGYGPDAEGAKAELWICKPYNGQDASAGNGSMLALNAASRAQVDAAYAAAIAAGGKDEGKPGLRDYAPNFYAAYFRDLDGNKLALVCRAEA
ncbi:VOC family protein [Paucibacter sp. APW11]|uniref:VOC family protein n=1 Tax=Roseateles aquae TaxID=3077235 RepID=A0ABU3PCP2_9BURK|nr:VOC family protein [Paucibacter sp. APW11]MDT9000354.1 VOC family protein [Paucibacter sp. APW11]